LAVHFLAAASRLGHDLLVSDDIAPSWIPKTEAELSAAIDQGAVREDHHHDFKAKLADGAAGNTHLAIDLASFAVDGGLLVVGVDENPSPHLVPLTTAGLPERIDQIAGSRIDPPLRVTTRTIPAVDQPGRGYLVVAVPASPAAPHAVDHVYRGRSDTTNTRLSDAEVRRIHDQRRRTQADADDLLSTFINGNPLEEAPSRHSHLFVVVQPVYADPEMLVRVLGENPLHELSKLVRNSPALTEDFFPDFEHVHTGERRAAGWSILHADTRDPESQSNRDDALTIEFREDGGVRLFCGRAGDVIPSMSRLVVMPSIIGGLLWRMIDLGSSIASLTGYVGNWHVAVGVTRMGGSHGWHHGALLDNLYYEGDYRASITATFADLEAGPDALVARLLGRLGRALAGREIDFPRRR
jgi:hypothetical protein